MKEQHQHRHEDKETSHCHGHEDSCCQHEHEHHHHEHEHTDEHNHCCEDHSHGHCCEGHSHGHSHSHSHNHGHCCDEGESLSPVAMVAAFVLLVGGLVLSACHVEWFSGWVTLAWYACAFLLVGHKVVRSAIESARRGDVFSEFMLMTIASVGAFCIGEYPEGVAVMLFYCVGEWLQDKAVDRARGNIEQLLAIKPDKADVVTANGTTESRLPGEVKVGEIIEVRAGQRVPLDGELLSAEASFNTAALTGESMPRQIATGEEVLAGMIATDTVVRLRVARPEKESAITRILNMVEDAAARKAPAELFIRRFARVYTPTVIVLAALTVIVPWLVSLTPARFAFDFGHWFYRALIFLVISCPCALVISIPLSYFAGIGAASKRGILFKGGNYLDAITAVDTVVFDKTGTLTTGEFSITRVEGLSATDLQQVAAIEQASTHPIAKAIIKGVNETPDNQLLPLKEITNIAGYGLKAMADDGSTWLVGTLRLLEREGVAYPETLAETAETLVAVSKNGHFIGYILLSDTLKSDAKEAVSRLSEQQISTEMLSGDKQALVDKVAELLGVGHAVGDLLPEGKVKHLQMLRKADHQVAFVGDGINDAPVLATSHVGIAMGALGSDVAIETADIVIQTDQPSRVAEAVSIGKRTRAIVKQNIVLAIGVKVVVMLLGVLGVANLWEAVFADVGVALLAVVNATRIFFGGKK